MSKSYFWDTVTEKLLSAIKADDLNDIKEILSRLNSKTVVNNLLNTCNTIDICIDKLSVTGMFTPLHYAVFHESISVIKYLLEEQSINVDQLGDIYGEYAYQHCFRHTALCHAIKKNQKHSSAKAFEIAKLLIETYGANVNLVPPHGIIPIVLACTEGDLEMVKLLVDNSAELKVFEFEDGRQSALPLLMISVKNNHEDVVKYLIEQGISVNEQDDFGHSPLHIAQEISIINVLLESGARMLKDNFGMTPLFRACMNNKESNVNLMLNHLENTYMLCRKVEIKSSILLGLSKLQHFQDTWLQYLTDAVDMYSNVSISKQDRPLWEEDMAEMIKSVNQIIELANSKSSPKVARQCGEVISLAITLLKTVLGETYPYLPVSLNYLTIFSVSEDDGIAAYNQLKAFYGMVCKPFTLESVASELLSLGFEVSERREEYYADLHNDITDIAYNNDLFSEYNTKSEYLNSKLSCFYERFDRFYLEEMFDRLTEEMLHLVFHIQESSPQYLKFKDIMERSEFILKREVAARKYSPNFFHTLFEEYAEAPHCIQHFENSEHERMDKFLHYATKITKLLPGLSVNCKDKDGNTPLHVVARVYSSECDNPAIKKEVVALVKLFLERGAREDMQNHAGYIPLDCIEIGENGNEKDPELLKLLNPRKKVFALQRLCVPVVKKFRLHLMHSSDVPENVKAFLAEY